MLAAVPGYRVKLRCASPTRLDLEADLFVFQYTLAAPSIAILSTTRVELDLTLIDLVWLGEHQYQSHTFGHTDVSGTIITKTESL